MKSLVCEFCSLPQSGIVFAHGFRVGGGKKFVRAVSQKP